ncbi:MAG: 16S rRNA (guanine(527)-N(7))-methyltransferase RsmG [Zwartia sp.]
MRDLTVKASTSERLIEALNALSLTATPSQQAALLKYLSQLLRWNKTYNLTAIRDPEQALIHHIFDSLSLVPSICSVVNDQSSDVPMIVDVGSGGGLPGVILAIMMPGVRVTCIDAVEKKTMFIRQMAGVLALQNLTVQHARIETLKPLQSMIVTSRAFASLEDFARLAGSHVREGGYLLAMKGRSPDEEIEALQTLTAWSVQVVQPLNVPELDSQRCLVWMQRKGTQ